jgi:hypothetical protein
VAPGMLDLSGLGISTVKRGRPSGCPCFMRPPKEAAATFVHLLQRFREGLLSAVMGIGFG